MHAALVGRDGKVGFTVVTEVATGDEGGTGVATAERDEIEVHFLSAAIED